MPKSRDSLRRRHITHPLRSYHIAILGPDMMLHLKTPLYPPRLGQNQFLAFLDCCLLARITRDPLRSGGNLSRSIGEPLAQPDPSPDCDEYGDHDGGVDEDVQDDADVAVGRVHPFVYVPALRGFGEVC